MERQDVVLSQCQIFGLYVPVCTGDETASSTILHPCAEFNNPAWIQVPLATPAPFWLLLWTRACWQRQTKHCGLWGAGEKTVAHGHKPGCLLTSEVMENAHVKQMMTMQWLQSSKDCGCLLIPAVPTQQCAWETFHDSPLELLIQKV